MDQQAEHPRQDIGKTVENPEAREREHSPRETVRQTRAFQQVLGSYRSALTGIHDSGLLERSTHVKDALGRIHSAAEQPADGDRETRTLDVKHAYEWLREYASGTIALMEHAVPDDKHEELREMVATQLAAVFHAEDNGPDIQMNNHLIRTAEFLMQQPSFAETKQLTETTVLQEGVPWTLKSGVWDAEDETDEDPLSNESRLDLLMYTAEAQAELAAIDPSAHQQEIQKWVAEMAREARSGRKGDIGVRKIYDTPFYQEKVRDLQEKGRKRNGIGSTIVYGPPGTGKTEIVREKNAQEGYRTHVITIHEHSTMQELLAEKPITMRVEGGVSQQTSDISQAITYLGGLSPDEFGEIMQELKEGDEAMDSFLLPHISQKEDVIAILAKKGAKSDSTDQGRIHYDSAEWEKIQQAFILKQRARIAAGIMGKKEAIEDIVRGEILLAMKRGERVLLDEMDKAGPNALGGLLTFLAKSPGETITYGETTITIPHWFRVDATSNKTKLDDYLVDRFTPVRLETPPVKDQLMIAAVRLSDQEGKIKLAPYEQEQLAAFFLYALPTINDTLTSTTIPGSDPPKKYSPLSNRWLQELTSNLVDFTDKRRRKKSIGIGDEIRASLINNRIWGDKSELGIQIGKILQGRFSETLANQPVVVKRRFGVDQIKAKKADEAENDSPIYAAIAGVEDTPPDVSVRTVEEIALNGQKPLAESAFTEVTQPKPHIFPLDNGLAVGLNAGMKMAGILARRMGGLPHELLRSHMKDLPPGYQKITASSSTGETVITATEEMDKFVVMSPVEQSQSTEIIGKGEIQVTNTGTILGHLSEEGVLMLYRKLQGSKISEVYGSGIEGVDSYQFSPDGRCMVLKYRKGGIQLIDIGTGKQITEEPLSDMYEGGDEWRFVSDHVLVQRQAGAVQDVALYIK